MFSVFNFPVQPSCSTCSGPRTSCEYNNSNGENPVTVEGICLQLKAKSGSMESQHRGSFPTSFLNISLTTLIIRSALPAVWWCSTVENTGAIPSMFSRFLISWFLKWVPLSDCIIFGMPVLAKTSISAFATFFAVTLDMGMNSGQCVACSTMIRTKLLPEDDLGDIGPKTSITILFIVRRDRQRRTSARSLNKSLLSQCTEKDVPSTIVSVYGGSGTIYVAERRLYLFGS